MAFCNKSPTSAPVTVSYRTPCWMLRSGWIFWKKPCKAQEANRYLVKSHREENCRHWPPRKFRMTSSKPHQANNGDKERQGTNPPAPGFPHQVNAGSSLPQLAIWWASVHQCSRHHLVQRCAKMCKVMQSAQKCQKVPKSSSVYLVALADTTFGEFSFESLVIRFDPVKEQEPEDRTTLLLGSAVDLNSTWTEQCSEWACKACKASKSSMRCSTVHERKELTGATRFHTVRWQYSYVRHTIQSKGPKVSIANPNL